MTSAWVKLAMCGVVGVVLFIAPTTAGVPKTLSSEKYNHNCNEKTYLDAISELLQGLMGMFDINWPGHGARPNPGPLGGGNAKAYKKAAYSPPPVPVATISAISSAPQTNTTGVWDPLGWE